MLTYESEGFLEVESQQIQQLCRSTDAVTLDNQEFEFSPVHAVLCNYLENSEPRCRVAFYSKVLKRAFVFAVQGSENQSSWQSGQEALVQLGFQLEEVKLKLSPAMLEVVLRDVPGLLAPGEARKQRTEKSSLLAALQNTYDQEPDSVQGKKAALKLSAEKRLNAQSEVLRHALEKMISKKNATAEFEVLACQVSDLTSRLKTAEALAESERNQREMSESITSAAEKRIQELEEVLVKVETKSSKTLKQKQKNVQLLGRIKKLDEELSSAAVAVAKEREKQEQFMADVNAAHERITLLENERKEMGAILENTQAQLAEEQTDRAKLKESFQEAELRIKVLESELENAEKTRLQFEASAKMSEGVQAELAEAQQALQDVLTLNDALEGKLTTANKQNEGLRESLQVVEKAVHDKTRDETQMIALAEQNELLGRELKDLCEAYAQEQSIRKRLEDDVVEEGNRILELEASLAKMSKTAKETYAKKKDAEDGARELASLRVEWQELDQQFKTERQARKELESEVDEAHKLIDSLGRMVRETEESIPEQGTPGTRRKSEEQKVQELEEKLKSLESQLEQELLEQKRLARANAAAEKKIAEQEEMLAQRQTEQLDRKSRETAAAEAGAQRQAKPVKPLPHELRPAPKKGAFFRPDWELEGLPCQSSRQIFKAWETVFNVQTSLEGYPSQYCMAFLVVLRLEKQKNVYMLFRLKLNKHTLVLVPANPPKDEDSLQKTIKEGLNFLKMSGFEMDEMLDENIDSSLKNYFQEG